MIVHCSVKKEAIDEPDFEVHCRIIVSQAEKLHDCSIS